VYHSSIGSGPTVTLLASIADTLASNPGVPTPHASAADAVLNVTSHEHNETITDPTGGGWYDSSGYAFVTRKPLLPSFFRNVPDCGFSFQPLGRSPSGRCRNFANRLVASWQVIRFLWITVIV